ncbi:hypothetical protein EDC01DRAFT_636416 [Geopyxis carbonaria]|nr:hypothetical protein EDC01DRAFT_636416 [Geopyxis carbonaria]
MNLYCQSNGAKATADSGPNPTYPEDNTGTGPAVQDEIKLQSQALFNHKIITWLRSKPTFIHLKNLYTDVQSLIRDVNTLKNKFSFSSVQRLDKNIMEEEPPSWEKTLELRDSTIDKLKYRIAKCHDEVMKDLKVVAQQAHDEVGKHDWEEGELVETPASSYEDNALVLCLLRGEYVPNPRWPTDPGEIFWLVRALTNDTESSERFAEQ